MGRNRCRIVAAICQLLIPQSAIKNDFLTPPLLMKIRRIPPENSRWKIVPFKFNSNRFAANSFPFSVVPLTHHLPRTVCCGKTLCPSFHVEIFTNFHDSTSSLVCHQVDMTGASDWSRGQTVVPLFVTISFGHPPSVHPPLYHQTMSTNNLPVCLTVSCSSSSLSAFDSMSVCSVSV